MYYKCKRCGHEVARGCLPTVSCGLYLFFLMGCALLIANTIARLLRGDSQLRSFDVGWWRVIVAPLSVIVGFIVAFIGAIALNAILELCEYLAFVFRKCPECGGRRWSWGYTRGFGL